MLCGRRSSNGALFAATSLAILLCAESVGITATSSPRELFTAIDSGAVVERCLELFARTHCRLQLTQVYSHSVIVTASLSREFRLIKR